MYKKAISKYSNAVAGKNTSVKNLTKLYIKKCNAYEKSHESRNNSTNANRRAQKSFYNSGNATMNNPHISAKKKYGILTSLMKTQKVSNIPCLIDSNKTIINPQHKSNLLNKEISSKSTIPGSNEVPPPVDKFEVLSDLSQINTSPNELSEIIRIMKKSNQSHWGIPGKFLSLIATSASYSYLETKGFEIFKILISTNLFIAYPFKNL